MFPFQQAAKVLTVNLLVLALALFFAELSCQFLIWLPIHTRLRPSILLGVSRKLYGRTRQVPQWTEDGGRYDEQLFYTLKPGFFRFRGPEFDVDVRVNALGVRGSEAELSHPEFIVLGDSHATGWGVNEENAFPRKLGALMGVTVLPVAVPSYGTARELMLLNRVDTTRMKILVIQYCENDFGENQHFMMQGGNLKGRGRDLYDLLVDYERAPILGRYLHVFWQMLRHQVSGFSPSEKEILKLWKEEYPKPDGPDEADAFLWTLRYFVQNRPLQGVQLILTETSGRDFRNRAFLSTVRARIAAGRFPDVIQRMQFVDLNHALEDDDYFLLDDHENAVGHEKIAARLYGAIRHVD